MELLPIGSKGRTEVLRDAANQGIEVINHLKVEIVFSDGNGPDFILELLQGFGSDAPGTAGQDKPQEGINFSIGSDRCLLGTMFASKGEITPPCGVPLVVAKSRPSSSTPQRRKRSRRSSTLPSAT